MNKTTDNLEMIDNINSMMYYENGIVKEDDIVNAKEMLQSLFRATGNTQTDVAKKIGWTRQNISQKLKLGTIRVDDLINILNVLDIELKFVDKKTKNEIIIKNGYGPRLRMSIDKVVYDTKYATPLSNNFYADGINEYNDSSAMELYIDKEGRYFIAHYFSFESVKNYITPISANEAASFIESHGTVIDKTPKAEELIV